MNFNNRNINNQIGAIPLLMIVAVIGVLGIMAMANLAPFKGSFLGSLYPKDKSYAALSGPISGPVDPSVYPSPTPISNLITNASMEQATLAYPSDWWKRSGGSWDSTISHTGKASLKVVGPAVFTYSQQNNSLKPNTRYTFGAWIKPNKVNGKGGGIRYAQLVPVSKVLENTVGTAGGIKGTSDWKYVTRSFVTPADYKSGRLDLTWELNAGDTIWFDDIFLCEGLTQCN